MTEQVIWIDPPTGERSDGADMAEELRKSCHLELTGIYFNSGSALLLEKSQPALNIIARLIVQSKEPVLTIAGHTDEVGAAEFNQTLSEKRAAAVRQALIAQFNVPPGRLVTQVLWIQTTAREQRHGSI